jgi:hypothetical protein
MALSIRHYGGAGQRCLLDLKLEQQWPQLQLHPSMTVCTYNDPELNEQRLQE